MAYPAFLEAPPPMSSHRALPRSIWALGLVSMFMDISSEMIHGVLPLFLVSVLGASTMTVGVIDGLGESIALITKVFSGWVSDWLGKRKVIIVAGYLLATCTKPLFAVASGAGLVLVARALDRFGKGMRGAPRDALVADLIPAGQRGAAYGLRQSLDSLGAIAGPLIAVLLLGLTRDNFRAVFWLALLPGALAVTVLLGLVRDPGHLAAGPARLPVRWSELQRLGGRYWRVVAVAILFTLARFSEAFVLLRAKDVGVGARLVPLVLVVMNIFYALGAYPAGRLSDRLGRRRLLAAGLVALLAADLILAQAGRWPAVALGAALWGVHLALTQGLFAALVAEAASPDARGTAFGVYGLATGLAVLLASVLAGWLWQRYGAPVPFLAGGCLVLLTLAGFLSAAGPGH